MSPISTLTHNQTFSSTTNPSVLNFPLTVRNKLQLVQKLQFLLLIHHFLLIPPSILLLRRHQSQFLIQPRPHNPLQYLPQFPYLPQLTPIVLPQKRTAKPHHYKLLVPQLLDLTTVHSAHRHQRCRQIQTLRR